MDLTNSILTQVKIQTVLKGSGDVLPQLQQAGAFRAIVLEARGTQVLLDTAFGQISTRTSTPPKAGDVIIARLDQNNPQNLKIEQYLPRTQLLQSSALFKTVSQLPQQTGIATVIRQQGTQAVLQLGDRQVTVKTQQHVSTGETFLLKATQSDRVELTRIQTPTVLKRALSQLLPQLQGQPPDAAVRLNQLIQQVLSPRPEVLTQWLSRYSQQASTSNSPTIASAKAADAGIKANQPSTGLKHDTSPPSMSARQDVSTNQAALLPKTQLTTDRLSQLLQLISQVASVQVNGTRPSAENILDLLRWVSLVKPDTSATSDFKAMPQQLQALMQLIKQSPESLNQLLRDWVVNLTEGRQTPVADRSLLDLTAGLRQELLHQVEQTMTQLLVQKTSLRLQIEQQSLLQFHLNIPLQVDDKTSNLKLRIRQRDRNPQTDQQSWEINLSFEFGLLGLITTHLLLQDRTLSAHFWSVKPQTTALIDTHLDDFRRQLVEHGFQLGDVASHPGQPVATEEDALNIEDNLVDINV